MFNRSISDGLPNSSASSLNTVARADLAVGAPSEVSELPQRAVPEAASPQQLPQDHHRLNQEAKSLEYIRSAVDTIQRSKDDSEKLEALRAKLTLAHKSIGEHGSVPSDIDGLLHEAAVRTDLLLGGDDKEMQLQEAGLLKVNSVDDKMDFGVPDKARVLGKIEAALNRIGQLQDKLGRVERNGYDHLLGLNLSVNGLNTARAQVDDSFYSVSAASTAVENILINIRTAIVAHGRASPEIVRLVLGG